MPAFGVTAGKDAALQALMARVGLREADLEERFVRASGPGGQFVNKVSTCVQLRHRPTGLEVKVQRERSQALNRFLARRLLAEKLERRILGARSAAERERAKIRRQKRKRSQRTKEKLLRLKRLRSATKALRQTPSAWEE